MRRNILNPQKSYPVFGKTSLKYSARIYMYQIQFAIECGKNNL